MREKVYVSPDGQRYLAMADGKRVARPFHLRWLMPLVCGMELPIWFRVRTASLLAMIPLGFAYAGGGWPGVLVAFTPVGLAGVWRIHWKFPILVDAPAMALGLAAAVCWRYDLYPAAIVLVLVAGMTKETAPIFTAVWAWTPWLLIGMIGPAVRALFRQGPDVLDAENAWVLKHPVLASRKYHAGMWLDPDLWVWPWGVCLLALVDPSPQVLVALALAYGQVVLATDAVRLYQWAWPPMALAAATVLPPAWIGLLVVVHLANPKMGEGL